MWRPWIRWRSTSARAAAVHRLDECHRSIGARRLHHRPCRHGSGDLHDGPERLDFFAAQRDGWFDHVRPRPAHATDDDRQRRLLGVLSLRDLLVADDLARIEDVMHRDLETIDPLEPARRAAERVTNSHLAAVPVVSGDGRLLGAVTIDAAVAQIAPQAWAAQAPRVFS